MSNLYTNPLSVCDDIPCNQFTCNQNNQNRNDQNELVILSKQTLTPAQTAVLRKGLSFIPKSKNYVSMNYTRT